MPCYHPLPAWYGKERNASGKRPLVFSLAEAFKDRPVSLPCGRCIGCRLEYARQWAVRCMHEASLWDSNRFVTLTYEESKLPKVGDVATLRPRDMVLFLKRLRKRYGTGIRFFQCGEYGEELSRPHHHALLFNCSFSDERLHSGSGEAKLYVSDELSKLWGHGFAVIGDVTFESAGYVARYSLKKVRGFHADKHYGGRVPEYLTMSRRPGVGHSWIHRFAADVYPSDELVVNGHITKPPRYYDDVVAKLRPGMLDRIKRKRRAAGYNDADLTNPKANGTGKRLLVREVVKDSATSFLSRKYEVDNGS
ncbi:MAG: replication initiator protein [Microviridae sp.]|nr:MAG: replication initiator protein [Microviridae sp.]